MTTLIFSRFLHCLIIAVVFVLSLLFGSADSVLAQEPQLQGGEVLDGLLGDISALAIDKNNLLWIGLRYGGIAVLENNHFRVFDRYNTNIPDARITAIFVDNNNVKWFGTIGGYVYTFDDREWRIMPTPPLDWIIRIGQTDKLFVASRRDLWSYSDSRADTFTLLSHFDQDRNRFSYFRDFYPVPNISPQEWEALNDIEFNPRTGLLYMATRTGLREYRGSQLLNVYTPSNSGLRKPSCNQLFLDSTGYLWIDYGSEFCGITKYDGEHWTHFNEGTPLFHRRTTDLVSTEDGRVWFAVFSDGLMMFDGDTWTSYPPIRNDPRIFWRAKPLAELFNDETIRPDIHQVLANPLPYRGKKISIIGRIRSGFEYSDIIDGNGEPLHTWVSFVPPLQEVLRETWMDTIIYGAYPRGRGTYWSSYTSNLVELVGYLEFSGSYGHMGGAPFQFDITEVYPYPISELERQEYQDTYTHYYFTRAGEEKEIRDLVEDWRISFQRGDRDHLISLLHPDGYYYNNIDTVWYGGHYPITILPSDLTVNVYPDHAKAQLSNSLVWKIEGDTSDLDKELIQRVVNRDIYVESISLKKYNGIWKISDLAFRRSLSRITRRESNH